MSVESTITKVMYEGNGLTTEWPVPFKYNKPEHLFLLVTDASGGQEQVTSNFQVQVTEAGDTSILYPVSGLPLPAGKRLTIYRATPQTQIVDLIYGGAFSPEVLEADGLDRAVMMIQEQQEEIDRAVKVGIDSDETPEALLESIFASRDTAVASASSAQASANAAAGSAQSAAGSAAIAAEQREAACVCAGEAQAARDAAIAQTEAANTLMEAELAKVNAIVAANRTDQEAAITASRAWAEKAPDVPVDCDEEGNPRYSARHWADRAQKIAIEPPTATRRGGIRVGEGLHLATGANGETDLLTPDTATEEQAGIMKPDGVTTAVEGGVLSAVGGNLLYNRRLTVTESGEFTAPFGGWYRVIVIGGGGGGGCGGVSSAWGGGGGGGGGSGAVIEKPVWLSAGQTVNAVIGAGGAGAIRSGYNDVLSREATAGGTTTFGDIAAAGGSPGFDGGGNGRTGGAGGAGGGGASGAGGAGCSSPETDSTAYPAPRGAGGSGGFNGTPFGGGGGGGTGASAKNNPLHIEGMAAPGSANGMPGGVVTGTNATCGGDGGDGAVIVEYHVPPGAGE